MRNLITCTVSVLQGKKEIVVGSKVSQSEFDMLQSVCDREDRSMSYVLRELAIRGIAQYMKDGQIRTSASDDAAIAAGRTKMHENITVKERKRREGLRSGGTIKLTLPERLKKTG